MTIKTLTATEAVDWIRNTNGRIFAVRFKKRTTGEERTMACRLGVRAYLTGAGPAYDFATKKLLPVFEMPTGGYKAIPLDGLTAVHLPGGWATVTHNQEETRACN